MSPLQWITGQRIERARQLLEETDHPVEKVARDSGFGTAASLRQHLQSELGVSPSAYRATFRGVPPGADIGEAPPGVAGGASARGQVNR